MKTLRHLFLLAISCLLFTSIVHAETSTDSAAQIRDAVQKKVAEELSNIKKSVAKRAFVGTIASKSDATITITNLKNQTRTAILTAATTIKLAGNKDGTPTDIKVGNFVIAMGEVDSQNVLTTTRLVVTSKPSLDTRRSVMGTVTKISSSTLTIEDSQKQSWTIKTTSDTKFTPTATKFQSLKTGDKVIIIGTTTSSENTLSAKSVHLIPGLSKPSPTPSPTP